MIKIGIFSTHEQFSADLAKYVNKAGKNEVHCEPAIVGEVRFMEKSPYRLIIDRLSSHVPYFCAYFRNAALMGTYVINNPFCRLDRFNNYHLARKIGLAVPRTVCLPSREYHPACSQEDLENLKYPLGWEEIADFVGFPAILKPYEGYGFRDVFKVNTIQELIHCYNGTGRQVMLMQENLAWDYYVKMFVVSQKETCIIIHDIAKDEYSSDTGLLKGVPLAKIKKEALQVLKNLDVDFCTVEFAVKDKVPYVVNFINLDPDCRLECMNHETYDWVLEKLAALAVKTAQSDRANTCGTV